MARTKSLRKLRNIQLSSLKGKESDRKLFWDFSSKVRIFRRPIRAAVSLVEKIVQATVCLHNYLRLTDNAMYCPVGFVDSEDSSGEIREGEWRTIVAADQGAFQHIETPRGRPQNDATLG